MTPLTKRLRLPLLTLAALTTASCATNNPKVHAPVFDVRAYGAKGDGATKDTAAFQQALDAAADKGAVVRVPAGTYLVGSLVLHSRTTLRFDQGAALTGSPDKDDYPLTKIRWEGRMREGHRALLFADHATNVTITGPDPDPARGGRFSDHQSTPTIAGNPALGHLRNPRGPALIEFLECRDVTLENFSTRYERMWSIHPTFTTHFTARNLTIRATLTNGDGIDVDSCKKVTIDHCDIDSGDDAIAIKSGRSQEAVDLARPSEDVTITDCRLGSAFAGLAIGSEISGGVRNVTARGLTFTHGSNGIFIKSNKTRGGFIENVHCTDLTSLPPVRCFLRIALLNTGIVDEQAIPGPAGLTATKNFTFENIKTSSPTFVEAAVISDQKPLQSLTIKNATGHAKNRITLANVQDAHLENINVTLDAPGPLLRTHNVTGTGLADATPFDPNTYTPSDARRRRPSTRPAPTTAPTAGQNQ